MKKVININFQGSVVPIEETAYDLLQNYTDSLRRYFAEEEGKDEIINDIESRISELFQQRLKNGATCITDDDVNAIIGNMGRPEDFEKADGDSRTNQENTTQSSSSQQWRTYEGRRLYRDENNKILGGVCSGIGIFLNVDPWIVRILFIISGIGFPAYIILWIFLPSEFSLTTTGARKKLYRNPDDKILGGVCSGIGSYFDINPWLPRIIFLLPLITFILRWNHFAGFSFPDFIRFTFSPGTLLVYIILWMVIPEARTTSEKLEMKGEKIDLNSIKESVVKEMKGVGERVGKMGMEAGAYIKNKGPEVGKDFGTTVNKGSAAVGRIILLLIKIFLYIILACVAFSIIIAVFAVGFVAIEIFPLKDFIVADGWQSILAWLTLIFFIGIPVVGVITFIIRKIARVNRSSKAIRYSFIGLWVFGWICFFALISLVGRDFSSVNTIQKQSLNLVNPATPSLEIRPINAEDFRWTGWFTVQPFKELGIEGDTARVGNVQIRIIQSSNDSFQVKYLRLSNGPSREKANQLASLVSFNGYQQDSVLYLDNIIPINKTDKFRNQRVLVYISVPVGHRIMINHTFRPRHRVSLYSSGWDNWYWDRIDSKDYDFDYGREYIMRFDGLHAIGRDWDDESDDENNSNSNRSGEPYRYPSHQIDSITKQHNQDIHNLQEKIDSAKESQKKEMERIQDSLRNQRNEIDKKLKSLERKTVFNKSQLPIVNRAELSYPFLSYI